MPPLPTLLGLLPGTLSLSPGWVLLAQPDLEAHLKLSSRL